MKEDSLPKINNKDVKDKSFDQTQARMRYYYEKQYLGTFDIP